MMPRPEDWQHLYEKYQQELLEQGQIIGKLRAREATWREIAEAVTDVRNMSFGLSRDAVLCYNDNTGDLECPWCNGRETAATYQHEPECPVTQARVLLANEA